MCQVCAPGSFKSVDNFTPCHGDHPAPLAVPQAGAQGLRPHQHTRAMRCASAWHVGNRGRATAKSSVAPRSAARAMPSTASRLAGADGETQEIQAVGKHSRRRLGAAGAPFGPWELPRLSGRIGRIGNGPRFPPVQGKLADFHGSVCPGPRSRDSARRRLKDTGSHAGPKWSVAPRPAARLRGWCGHRTAAPGRAGVSAGAEAANGSGG